MRARLTKARVRRALRVAGTDGAPRDEATAVRYYRRAGEAGQVGALCSLGALLYRAGRLEEVRWTSEVSM
jgi:TPR repeat protein